MEIDLINESNNDCGFNATDLESIATDILNKLDIKKPHSTIEVFLVADEKIKKLNKKYRDKNEATDVLSFPQKQFLGTSEQTLGTIFIAPEFAKNENISCKKLFIHGFLHLLGFDHETDETGWKKIEEKTTNIIH